MAEPFKFPHETDDENIEIEVTDGDVEIEVVDDTPERDRGRKPPDRRGN
jgi:hypothetical protein